MKSPYYSSQYPSNTNCSWLIVAPPGHRLTISFKDFKTSIADKLKIYDGPTANFTLIGEFKGSFNGPDEISSSSESLYIVFKSTNRDPRNRRDDERFKMEYRKFKGITKLQY